MSWIGQLDIFRLPSDVIIQLTDVYQYKGRQQYHDDVIGPDIKLYIEQTMIQDVEEFAKLLELQVTPTRLATLARKDMSARNNAEKTLLKFKQVLNNIMYKNSTFAFSTNEIQAIHAVVFEHIANTKFARTESKSKLISQRVVNKRLELDEVLDQIEPIYRSNRYERLILVLLLFVDFYNIKAFQEMNEYTALLLLHLLLLKAGFDNFKYVSFYGYVNDHLDEYKKAIIAASFSYEEGLSQPLPIIRFFLKALVETSKEVAQLVKNHEYDQQLNKSYSLENTIFKLPQVFQKEDLRRIHPGVSDSTINRTLVRLREEGVVRPLGKGRSAKWMRIQNKDKFDVEQQITLDMLIDE